MLTPIAVLTSRVKALRKAVAALEARQQPTDDAAITALGQRLDHRVDNLERLCFHLRDSKLDKTAVVDEVLELLRRPRR